MGLKRFFLPPDFIETDKVRFPGDIARQMQRVLRLRKGDQVIALDGRGGEYTVRIDYLSPEKAGGEITAKQQAVGEAVCMVALYVSLSQREKFEWILQKCTEVGVSIFIPVVSERSLVQKLDVPQKKMDRWNSIIREAAEQSGRGRLPVLSPPKKFQEAVESSRSDHDLALMLWEQERTTTIRKTLVSKNHTAGTTPEPLSVAILIGPEGGFSSSEVEASKQAGIKPVTLGRRILRMETAAVVAAALVLHELGDMG